jgi:hypothetical protein
MKASWIFTTNDVIANAGVLLAAGLVRRLQHQIWSWRRSSRW